MDDKELKVDEKIPAECGKFWVDEKGMLHFSGDMDSMARAMLAQFNTPIQMHVGRLKAQLAAEVKENAHNCFKIDQMINQLAELKCKILRLEGKVFAEFNGEECWIFQPDGDNHLEELVCPVVIHPADLIAEQQGAEPEARMSRLVDCIYQLLESQGLYIGKVEANPRRVPINACDRDKLKRDILARFR